MQSNEYIPVRIIRMQFEQLQYILTISSNNKSTLMFMNALVCDQYITGQIRFVLSTGIVNRSTVEHSQTKQSRYDKTKNKQRQRLPRNYYT